MQQTEERSADKVAAAVWLIPFHHTEHCARHADKNTQSNKQKEKREREREYPIQFYLDDTGKEGWNAKKYIELKEVVRRGLERMH